MPLVVAHIGHLPVQVVAHQAGQRQMQHDERDGERKQNPQGKSAAFHLGAVQTWRIGWTQTPGQEFGWTTLPSAHRLRLCFFSLQGHIMSRIYADNARAIGNTPLVMINRQGPKGVTILAKIEGRNPAHSVKCRIGAGMIWDAEENGSLKPGMTLVEPTSGNTGIGLAF